MQQDCACILESDENIDIHNCCCFGGAPCVDVMQIVVNEHVQSKMRVEQTINSIETQSLEEQNQVSTGLQLDCMWRLDGELLVAHNHHCCVGGAPSVDFIQIVVYEHLQRKIRFEQTMHSIETLSLEEQDQV